MANGLKRISTTISAFLGFDPAEISKIRSAILAAVEDSKPVKSEKLESKIREYENTRISELDAIYKTVAGDAVYRLDSDVDSALSAWRKGVDGAEILDRARRENQRAARGLDLEGGGDIPHDTWIQARSFARNIEHGLMNEDKAIGLLSSKAHTEDRLRDALGRFFAGYQAAIDEMGKIREEAAVSVRRAQAMEDINVIHLNDNLRRARQAGKDLSPVMSDAVAKGMEEGLKRGGGHVVDRIKAEASDSKEIADLKQMVSELSKLVHALTVDKVQRPAMDGE